MLTSEVFACLRKPNNDAKLRVAPCTAGGRLQSGTVLASKQRRMADRPPYLLCVDDDTLVLNLLREHFTHQGFIVLTATNGVDACVQVRRWRPRAAILDLMLPGVGGIGTLNRIRALNPGMAVIVLSGNDNMLSLATMAGLSVTGAF